MPNLLLKAVSLRGRDHGDVIGRRSFGAAIVEGTPTKVTFGLHCTAMHTTGYFGPILDLLSTGNRCRVTEMTSKA